MKTTKVFSDKKGNRTLGALCLASLLLTAPAVQAEKVVVIPLMRTTNSGAASSDCADDGYEVLSGTGQCWMAFNLGATQVATSISDSAAYGDLYQWGRMSDGHESRTSALTDEPATSDNPGHSHFILFTPYSPADWRDPHNDLLWQGIGGVNNPCPQGFRIPTEAEWQAEIDYYGATGWALFNSPLKLVVAGIREGSNGFCCRMAGSIGYYWSSRDDGTFARYLMIKTSTATFERSSRANGFSVRCIKN